MQTMHNQQINMKQAYQVLANWSYGIEEEIGSLTNLLSTTAHRLAFTEAMRINDLILQFRGHFLGFGLMDECYKAVFDTSSMYSLTGWTTTKNLLQHSIKLQKAYALLAELHVRLFDFQINSTTTLFNLTSAVERLGITDKTENSHIYHNIIKLTNTTEE